MKFGLQNSKKSSFIILALLFSSASFPGLFEQATTGERPQTSSNAKGPELNGYIRSNVYIGRDSVKKNGYVKQTLGEMDLKTRVKRERLGDAYANARIKGAVVNGTRSSDFELREAYVNTYWDRFDLRLGHQIVAWGKADGINPTNNITPRDISVFSPDEDDRRLANFLLKGVYNFLPFRMEFIWIPVYRANTMPSITLPAGLALGSDQFPGSGTNNQSIALKMLFEGDSLDSSLSYFKGYSLTNGLVLNGTSVSRSAFLHQVLGLDFSSSFFSPYGIRGEVAYKRPKNYKKKEHVPLPELHYVFGIDKEFFSGDLSIIAQYIGRHVFDWRKLDPNCNTCTLPHSIRQRNRVIQNQTEKTTHSAALRIAYSMLQETLELDTPFSWNFSTKELFLRPKVVYSLTDDLEVTAGAEYYHGPSNTLSALIKYQKSAAFLELKVSF